ncbi:MAG: hydantoinase/oxoprolinase family protein [Peptococcaceae bacterium]|nr:hydantoinase/oxoprolinase family protein [Peptococcaceae bacterium]
MDKCIGLDVGGTFTDIALVDGEMIECTGKVRTQPDDILGSVLNALDSLAVKDVQNVKKITVSTTLVTNAIMEERLPRVETILFPGSGLLPESLPWPFAFHRLSGELDFRGRMVRDADRREWLALVDTLRKLDLPDPLLFCVVGKFSHINKVFEENLTAFLREEFPRARFALGHRWGQINFFRRAQTSYLNLAASSLYENFVRGLQTAVRARGYKAPVSVLKANGGVLPIDKASAVQTIYSGPAASVLGALAQTGHRDSFFVVDVGGTTTDIGAVLAGEPMLGSLGACIGKYKTNVRSLAVRSVPVGSDSAVSAAGGRIKLADYRSGPAFCLGGPALTPTDALCYLGLADYGNRERAREALLAALPPESVLPPKRRSSKAALEMAENAALTTFAERIISVMTAKISDAMGKLRRDWEDEPAYRVWDVLRQDSDRPFYMHLSGGSAPALATAFAKRMPLPVELAKHAESTNALGTALARPSFTSTLHLDTREGVYRIVETGETGPWRGRERRPYDEAEVFLRGVMMKRAREMGLTVQEIVQDDFSYFPQVEDNRTVGHIVRGSMHLPVGVMGKLKGGSRNRVRQLIVRNDKSVWREIYEKKGEGS